MSPHNTRAPRGHNTTVRTDCFAPTDFPPRYAHRCSFSLAPCPLDRHPHGADAPVQLCLLLPSIPPQQLSI